MRRPLEAVQHGGWPVQHGVEADHAQRVGSPGDQRPGRGVRPVGELADGSEHLVPGGGANIRMVVEDPGHGLMGDPGQPRDVGHDRRPAEAGQATRAARAADHQRRQRTLGSLAR